MANISAMSLSRGDILTTSHIDSIARGSQDIGVRDGCNVGAQAVPDMTVKLDAGNVLIGGVLKVVAGNNVTISAADPTNPRIDIIYVDVNGVGQVYTGAAGVIAPVGETDWKKFTVPYPGATIPTGVPLAEVHVGAGATSITGANVRSLATYVRTYRRQIQVIIDGGGVAIETGVKARLHMGYPCTIKSVTMGADQSGSIVVDIWKDTYANYPPTDADSITAAAVPTISATNKYQNTTLVGWTTSITADDWLFFNVDSCSSITQCVVDLIVET